MGPTCKAFGYASNDEALEYDLAAYMQVPDLVTSHADHVLGTCPQARMCAPGSAALLSFNSVV